MAYSWRISMLLAFLKIYLIFVTTADGKGNKVRLEDVSAITLRKGEMTTYRRTHAVPQLKCVGGTAGCSSTPEVVQCYNRGSDGLDVQWECKADLDNRYKFGKIEVLCEGYDDRDDPYILKGSCGLEYELDFTKEGYERKTADEKHTTSSKRFPTESNKPTLISWIFLICVLAFVYQLYKSCIAQRQYSRTNDDDQQRPGRPSFRSGGSSGSYPGAPPPYPSDYSSFPGESCSQPQQPHTNAGFGRPGFWSGIGAGAGLGYLFGRNRGGGGWFGGNTGYGYGGPGYSGYARPPAYNPSYESSSSSSGSREASGFGGTRRR